MMVLQPVQLFFIFIINSVVRIAFVI
jgi:hypothetical protein